jgi:hypothetical protein
MVMSVPAENPRQSCIRCGRGELGQVEMLASCDGSGANHNSTNAASVDCLALVLQMVGEAAMYVASGV